LMARLAQTGVMPKKTAVRTAPIIGPLLPTGAPIAGR